MDKTTFFYTDSGSMQIDFKFKVGDVAYFSFYEKSGKLVSKRCVIKGIQKLSFVEGIIHNVYYVIRTSGKDYLMGEHQLYVKEDLDMFGCI